MLYWEASARFTASCRLIQETSLKEKENACQRPENENKAKTRVDQFNKWRATHIITKRVL